jgi:hypothetical protein
MIRGGSGRPVTYSVHVPGVLSFFIFIFDSGNFYKTSSSFSFAGDPSRLSGEMESMLQD